MLYIDFTTESLLIQNVSEQIHSEYLNIFKVNKHSTSEDSQDNIHLHNWGLFEEFNISKKKY